MRRAVRSQKFRDLLTPRQFMLLRPLFARCGVPSFRRASQRISARAMADQPAPAEPNFFRDVVYKTAKQEKARVPWDIGTHQPGLELVAETFRGHVLDVGSGTGDNALWVATLPAVTRVTSIDLSPDAVAISRQRLEEREPKPQAPLTFTEADVFSLAPELSGFDTWLDSAVFHCIGDDAAQRRYLAAVTPRIKLGGSAVLFVFSDTNDEATWRGPRRISEAHARALWTEAGWQVTSCRHDAFFKDSMGRNDGKGGFGLLMTLKRIA